MSVQLPVITPVFGGGVGWLAIICGFPRVRSVLLWMVDVGLDEGLLLEEGCPGPVREQAVSGQGASLRVARDGPI